MTILYINTGTSPNAGNGDSIRSAFTKINNNFASLETTINSGAFDNLTIAYTGTFADLVANNLTVQSTATFNDVYINGQLKGVINFASTSTFDDITVYDSSTLNQVTANQATITTATFTDATVNNLAVDHITGNVRFLNSSTFADIRVLNTATVNNLNVDGVITIGYYQGFDDVNIINDDPDGVSLRLRNMAYGSWSEFNLIDDQGGTSLTIMHQNSSDDSGRGRAGYNYIYSNSPNDVLNIGRYSDVYFWADRAHYFDRFSQTTASMMISADTGETTFIKGVNAGHILPTADLTYDLGSLNKQWRSLYVGTSTIYIGGNELTINDSGILLVNGSEVQGGGGNGYTGSQGTTGALGYTGSRGIQGYAGSRGDMGPTGYTGSQGELGYTGSKGSLGYAGSMGYAGSAGADSNVPGPTGPIGPSVLITGALETENNLPYPYGGADGDSYLIPGTGHLWVWGVGTWTDVGAIQGPIGLTGPQGPQGPQGDLGPTGYTGSQGDIGYTGSQGVQGYVGSQGDLGPTGYTGSQGDIGYTGSAGADSVIPGPQGARGWTGSMGLKGDQGDPGGYTGSAGLQGNKGFTGSAGDQGPQGYTGSGGLGYTGSQGEKGDQGEPGGNANTANFVFTNDEMSVVDNGDITVVTNANTWTFGADGTLTIPGNISSNTSSFGVYALNVETDSGLYINADPTPGSSTILYGTQNVTVRASNNLLPFQDWVFGTAGDITLPGGGKITTAGPSTDLVAGAGGWAELASNNGSNFVWVDDNGSYIVTNGTSTFKQWTFATDGIMSAPGHLIPNADLTYDLGSTTTQWRSIYVGTGTIYIGGVALGVNENNYVTVDGNPIITVNTAGNLTVQGDVAIGTVTISDVAPTASTGTQWYNSVDGRTYIAYNGAWIDSSPTVVPTPDTYLDEITIDGSTINMNGSTLAINNAGVLLVNGSEVTSSGSYTPTTPADWLGSPTVGTVTAGLDELANRMVAVEVGSGGGVIGSVATLTNGSFTLSLDNTGALVGSTGTDVTVIATTGSNTATWTFSANSSLTVPGPIISEGYQLALAGSQSSYDIGRYLLVRDGDYPSHLHLDTPDNATYDIYIGDDSRYVKVDHTGPVVIGTNLNTWTFAADGVLTLPVGGDIVDSNGTSVLGGGSFNTGTLVAEAVTATSASYAYSFNTGTLVAEAVTATNAGYAYSFNTGTLVATAVTAGTAGTVTTAAQPNITSVGTLTGLSVNGTIYNNGWELSTASSFSTSTLVRAAVSATTAISLLNGGNTLRPVAVPGNLAGAAGDTVGDIANDGSYLYYCSVSSTQTNYIGYTYGGASGAKFVSIVKSTYGGPSAPVAGMIVTHRSVSHTITSVTDQSTYWQLNYNTSESASDWTNGETVTVTTAPAVGDIWKTIPWNAITTSTTSTVSITNTASATTTATGALIVSGGVGIAKNAYVGGYVVQQALPAFRVVGNGGSVSTGTTLTSAHWTMDYNQGNHLNTSTGVFTVPVTGIYQVNLVMRTNSNVNPTINQAIVIRNTSTALCMLEFGVNTTMNHAGVSTAARLVAGDTVTVTVAVGTMNFDANDNWSIAFLG